jgi:hypothetical protein
MLPCVMQKFTDVSEVPTASIIFAVYDGDSKHLWNVGKLLPDYTRNVPEDSNLYAAVRTW